MNDVITLALEKLEKEFEEKITNQIANAIKKESYETLVYFCKQDEEFAQAVYQSNKTFSECLNEIIKDVGRSISDIEAYRRMVKFYFSTAEIRFEMKIDLIGSASGAETEVKETASAPAPKIKMRSLSMSLDDLFD